MRGPNPDGEWHTPMQTSRAMVRWSGHARLRRLWSAPHEGGVPEPAHLQETRSNVLAGGAAERVWSVNGSGARRQTDPIQSAVVIEAKNRSGAFARQHMSKTIGAPGQCGRSVNTVGLRAYAQTIRGSAGLVTCLRGSSQKRGVALQRDHGLHGWQLGGERPYAKPDGMVAAGQQQGTGRRGAPEKVPFEVLWHQLRRKIVEE